jgi:hypothetical protein
LLLCFKKQAKLHFHIVTLAYVARYSNLSLKYLQEVSYPKNPPKNQVVPVVPKSLVVLTKAKNEDAAITILYEVELDSPVSRDTRNIKFTVVVIKEHTLL